MFTVLIYIVSGCKEESRIDHIDDSAPAPTPVTLGEIKAKPGGAIIWYTVPNDKNLLGVKAVYERNGEICETKASVYTDSLTVEGFGDANPKEVKLYSVGRNEKLSEPVSVQIVPLEPPVNSVHVNMEATFGGVTLILENNISNADLAVVLMIDTTDTDEWVPLQTFYTQATSIKLSRRGLKFKEQKFGVYVKDRWNNKSVITDWTLTPIEEIELPKTDFRNAMLPGDTYLPYGGYSAYTLEKCWDGDISGIFVPPTSSPIPQHFTIDLGRPMSISRLQFFHRLNNEMYSGNAVRVFELWGSNDPPDDGSFDNWHKLGQWEQLKPSGYGNGSDVGPITDEDRAYFYSGGNYELTITDETPNPYMTVTYLRFITTATFISYGTDTNTGNLVIAELTFYGQLKDE
jgi:hypothetical protein